MTRIHGSEDQGVEIRVASVSSTSSYPLAKSLLPVSMTLFSTGPQVLFPEGGLLSPGDTTVVSLNWKSSQPPGHFGFFIPPNQQTKQGVMVLAGIMCGS